MQKVLPIFLYSNSLYGVAAVLLAYENNLKLGLPPNNFWFYIALGCGTTAFYLFSYQYDPHPLHGNRRALFIAENKKQLIIYRNILSLITLTAAAFYLLRLPPVPMGSAAAYLVVISFFPLLGLFYYGVGFPGLFRIRLRNFGWGKPFLIALVWVGCVCLIPWLLTHWEHYPALAPQSRQYYFVWLHDWMFISVLCILFDIKDYAADHNLQLKTFVVRAGLRRLLYQIVFPLVCTGMAALLFFMQRQQFGAMAIFLNLLPMVALLWVAATLRRRRPVWYFLLVIDGLMVVKAFCGILSIPFIS